MFDFLPKTLCQISYTIDSTDENIIIWNALAWILLIISV